VIDKDSTTPDTAAALAHRLNLLADVLWKLHRAIGNDERFFSAACTDCHAAARWLRDLEAGKLDR
jgi:hypothetical protein